MKETNRDRSGKWADVDIVEALKHIPKVGEYAYYYDYDENKDLATVYKDIVESVYLSERIEVNGIRDHMFVIHIKLKNKFEEYSMYFSQLDDPVDCDVFANMEDLKASIKWQDIANVRYNFTTDEPLKFELEEEVKSTYFY